MTTKPRFPRPNAIWFDPSSHQSVTVGIPAVAARNEIMPAIDGTRCSQVQAPTGADAKSCGGTHVGTSLPGGKTGVVFPSASDGGPSPCPAEVDLSNA